MRLLVTLTRRNVALPDSTLMLPPPPEPPPPTLPTSWSCSILEGFQFSRRVIFPL